MMIQLHHCIHMYEKFGVNIMKFVQTTTENKKTAVFLDLEGAVIPGVTDRLDPEVLTVLSTFSLDGYSRGKSGPTSVIEFDASLTDAERRNYQKWVMMFGAPCKFLATLSKEDSVVLADTMLSIHYQLLDMAADIQNTPDKKTVDPNKLLELETKLSEKLGKMDTSIHLFQKLVAFVKTDIPIQEQNNVGERPQDSKDMTFYYPHVVELTAVAVLCKLLSPIFSVFLTMLKNSNLDNRLKEWHCYTILKEILSHKSEELTNKLNLFIDRNINQFLKRQTNSRDGLTSTYNGYTKSVVVQTAIASLMVRKFVSVDLFLDSGNLMKYVTSCIRSTAKNGSNVRSGEAAQPFELKINQSAGDDGNISVFEVESRSSTKTAYQPIFIRNAVKETYNRFIFAHELDEKAVMEATAYYELHHPVTSPILQYLLGIMFGSELCGAKSIETLHSSSLTYLIPLMQVFFIQQSYHDLVHLVSAVPTNGHKLSSTGSESRLKSSWNTSEAFREVSTTWQVECNGVTWYSGLETAVNDLLERVYLNNTAPVIYDLMGQPVNNGTNLVVPETMSQTACQLILDMYQ